MKLFDDISNIYILVEPCDLRKGIVLESGEFSHSGSGEKRQFWSKEKSQHIR